MSEPKPMPSYWALAEEVTHLHGQLDKLKAENDRLREESAHLQSLVKQFYWCTKSMREALRQCKDTKPYYLEALDDTLAKVYDQMTELEVEVDA